MAVTRLQYRRTLARQETRHHTQGNSNGRPRTRRHAVSFPRKCASSSSLPLRFTSPIRSSSRVSENHNSGRSKSEGTKNNGKGKPDNGVIHKINRNNPGTSRSTKLHLRKTKKCTCIKAKHRDSKSHKKRATSVSSVGTSSSEASVIVMSCSSSSSVQLVDSGQTRCGKKRRRLLYNDNTKWVSRSESAVTIITISSDEPEPVLEPEQPGCSADLPNDDEDMRMLQNVLDTLEAPQDPCSDQNWPADLQDLNLFPLQPPLVPPPIPVAVCVNCSNRLWHDIITLAKFYGVGLCSNIMPPAGNPDSDKSN